MPSKKEEEDYTKESDKINKKNVRGDLQKKVGLLFPVNKIRNLMRKKNYARIISQRSAVTVAAVLEYLTAEVIEVSGDVSKDEKTNNLRPRHISLGIRTDKELYELVGSHVIIPMGGIVPYINASPCRKNKTKSNYIESQAEEESSDNEIEIDVSDSDI